MASSATRLESKPNANPWLPTMEILGDSYIDISPFQSPIFPKASLDAPINQHVRRGFANSGMVSTDAFLVEEIAWDNMRINLLLLTPTDDAPLGNSLHGSKGSVVPNDIFPLQFEDNHLFVDGVQQNSEFTVEVPSLASFGEFVDNDGTSYGFTELNYRELIFANWRGTGPNHSATSLVGTQEARSRVVDKNGDGWEVVESFTVSEEPTDVAGDLNYNGELDMHDLNILTRNVAVAPAEPHGDFLRRLDLNGDEAVDVNDVGYWVTELKTHSTGTRTWTAK